MPNNNKSANFKYYFHWF